MPKKTSKKSLTQRVKGFIGHYHMNHIGLIMIIIGIAIGLFVTAQFRTRPTRSTDSVISYTSLEKTKESLLQKQKDYKQQIQSIKDGIDSAQETIKLYSNSKDKVEKVENYEIKIGLTDMSGSGVYIRLDDSGSGDVSANSIAHAADIRDIINLLWGNGAKAINVNSERVVYSTSIDCIVNTVLINSTKTTPPFIIEAIGEQDNMYNALKDSDNLSDIYYRINEEGLIFEVEKRDDINISSFSGALNIEYAKVK